MYKLLFFLFCSLSLIVHAEDESSFFLDEVQAPDSEDLDVQPMEQHKSRLIIADESTEPDSGNWYEKLRWWKEAHTLYTEDIQQALQELSLLQEEYEQRYKEIIDELEHYSGSLPIKRQTAIPAIDQALEAITKRQEAIAREKTQNKKPADPNEALKLEEQQKLLNELKSDVTDFNALADRLKQSFDQLVPQLLQKAQSFNKEALEAYESIEETLDDKKAHQSFELVENCHENIRALISFLKGPLWNFIDVSWTKLKQLMPKVSTTMTTLESKGVSLKPQTDQKAQRTIEDEKAKKAREAEARPWWRKLVDAIVEFFTNIGSAIWYGVSRPFVWVGDMFSGSSQPAKKSNAKKVKKAPQDLSEQSPLPVFP